LARAIVAIIALLIGSAGGTGHIAVVTIVGSIRAVAQHGAHGSGEERGYADAGAIDGVDAAVTHGVVCWAAVRARNVAVGTDTWKARIIHWTVAAAGGIGQWVVAQNHAAARFTVDAVSMHVSVGRAWAARAPIVIGSAGAAVGGWFVVDGGVNEELHGGSRGGRN
jgi:hypothetical protein